MTDITGAAATGRIRAAAAIERATIEELFAGQIVDEAVMAFDRGSKQRAGAAGAAARGTAAGRGAGGDRRCRRRRLGHWRRASRGSGSAQLPWTKEQQALRERACVSARRNG